MRTKSLQAPANPKKGDRWLSPAQSLPVFDRVWNGTAWETYQEPAPTPHLKQQDPPKDPPKDLPASTEETKGERSNETAVSDRDGQQEPDAGAKRPADGKQGKGGQGKRK